MHIIIRDPTQAGEESTVCVERDTQTAIVLQSNFDQLDNLVRIAAAMKVPRVFLLVDKVSIPEFQEAGWSVSDRVVMEKKAR